MLVAYEESQLSDTTLIFSVPALSLSLPALSVSPSIFVSPLYPSYRKSYHPLPLIILKNVFIAPFCILSLNFSFFPYFYLYVILSLSLTLSQEVGLNI